MPPATYMKAARNVAQCWRAIDSLTLYVLSIISVIKEKAQIIFTCVSQVTGTAPTGDEI